MNEADAEGFLLTRFGGDVTGVAPIGHGEWSRAFSYRRAGAEYVIRFSAHETDFAKDRLAARHGSRELPVPEVLEIGEAFDGFFAISKRVAGGYLDELDAAGMGALLPALFGALDAARRADLSASAGYGVWGDDGQGAYPSWRAALLDVGSDRPDDRTHGWRQRLAASPTGSGPFEEALDAVATLVGEGPDERHLIHSDLLNYNVLVAGHRITAVIDWGCSMYGDFLYDLAWLTFWWPWYPAWAGIDVRREAERHYASVGLRVPRFDERLRACEVHIGLAGQAYSAFTGRWPELEATARRTLAVARRGR